MEVINEAEAKNRHTDYQCVIVSKGRKTNRGQEANKVYMHPYLFIDFAMWINPTFKYEVIKFVYDELIKNRHEAGDNYLRLSGSASMFPNVDYKLIAKGLNHIVFGKHYKGIRDNASEQKLKELYELEEKLVFAIDMGLIKNFGQLIQTMRDMWAKTWNPIS